MDIIYRQTQLYKFLRYCNGSDLKRIVLDCGAGGDCPPLALFNEFNYETYGIEISDKQLNKAYEFQKRNGVNLNILKGDMRNLTFKNESISFIYSYNTIFHMGKNDISKAIEEIKRVLKPGGLCFINFVSINDYRCGLGKRIGKDEYIEIEDGEKVIHSYHTSKESEKYFKDMSIVFKEERILERIYNGDKIKQGYIDYILEK
ncbi:MAG: class I SAM-dependent methyltransferase [Firmicutes bacterium]|nr:class I SAM-dependent methyltransferase [Bacillota bacterium]